MALTAMLCARLELSSHIWLSVQEMLAYERHHRSTAFPPPELPGFVGTMQPSDFPSSFDYLSSSDWLLILHARHFKREE
jgi:hypothetical protein